MAVGVYQAIKKDGSIYYRASVTYKRKHLSLGSFSDSETASTAYLTADRLLHSELSIHDYEEDCVLSFDKWVCLCNFRDHLVYIKNPIYLHKNYFDYYFTKDYFLKFDIDDLFYYSEHKILRRGNHLFVSDYGMQYSISSRYGIRSFAVEGRDYRFVNGDQTDYRYENIEIINQYHGVSVHQRKNQILYRTKIHIKSTYVVGYYQTETEAAIAYNKAVDELTKHGIHRKYLLNYVTDISPLEYAELYISIEFSKAFQKTLTNLTIHNNNVHT